MSDTYKSPMSQPTIGYTLEHDKSPAEERSDDIELKGANESPDTLEEAAEGRARRKALRKVDLRILPAAVLLYGWSYLDRAAIGNAKIAGLIKDLHMTDAQYKMSLSFFFIVYGVLEIPSNLLVRRLGARRVLPALAAVWSLAMIFTGVVKDFGGLLTCRIFLGVGEAGILPGLLVLMSFVYPADVLQLRIGILFGLGQAGGSVGGLLSYALVQVKHGSFESWRWIFIVEGLATLVTAGASYFLLVSDVSELKCLSPGEAKALARNADRETGDGVKWREVWNAFKDPKLYPMATTFLGLATAGYSLSLFLPTILRDELGYGPLKSQSMTIPVYLLGTVAAIITSFVADRWGHRMLMTTVFSLVACTGWIVTWCASRPGAQYFGCCLLAMGHSVAPCCLACTSLNVSNRTRRSTAIAFQVSMATVAALVASNIFPAKDAPKYPTAHKVGISLCLLASASAMLYRTMVKREMAQKRSLIESGEAAKLDEKQLLEMGEKSPYFQYHF